VSAGLSTVFVMLQRQRSGEAEGRELQAKTDLAEGCDRARARDGPARSRCITIDVAKAVRTSWLNLRYLTTQVACIGLTRYRGAGDAAEQRFARCLGKECPAGEHSRRSPSPPRLPCVSTAGALTEASLPPKTVKRAGSGSSTAARSLNDWMSAREPGRSAAAKSASSISGLRDASKRWWIRATIFALVEMPDAAAKIRAGAAPARRYEQVPRRGRKRRRNSRASFETRQSRHAVPEQRVGRAEQRFRAGNQHSVQTSEVSGSRALSSAFAGRVAGFRAPPHRAAHLNASRGKSDAPPAGMGKANNPHTGAWPAPAVKPEVCFVKMPDTGEAQV